MTYDQQILSILTEAGERGISVKALAMHVYNMNSTFFSHPDFQDIHRQVQQYLLRKSKSPKSPVEHTEHRGCYRLNVQRQAAMRQQLLDFS